MTLERGFGVLERNFDGGAGANGVNLIALRVPAEWRHSTLRHRGS
jgi:hypothetical protein